MKKKFKKIFLLILMIITLTACTTPLKGKDSKAITNPVTGQSLTENILCRPTDEQTKNLYLENGVDLEGLSECENISVIGDYQGLWTTLFVRPLAFVIIKLGTLVKSPILAIIIITLLIRMVLYPITKKTALQSENLKKAQPELNRIEKKYEGKDDQESMTKKSQEMLMVYKKYNINPISGCIFSLIQIPLLFAFLEVINRVPAIFEETIFKGSFIELQMGTTPWYAMTHGSWYYILISILIIVTTYLSFKITTNQNMNNNKTMEESLMEKQNKMMMITMVLLTGFLSFSLPIAIAIYWITSSLFTVIQNLFIIKKSKKEN